MQREPETKINVGWDEMSPNPVANRDRIRVRMFKLCVWVFPSVDVRPRVFALSTHPLLLRIESSQLDLLHQSSSDLAGT